MLLCGGWELVQERKGKESLMKLNELEHVKELKEVPFPRVSEQPNWILGFAPKEEKKK